MAWSLVAHTTAGAGANGGTSSAVNTIGADLFVVSFSWFNGGSVPTVSDSAGNTWIQVGSGTSSGDASYTTYYCHNPTTSASHTFTISCTGSYPGMVVQAWSGSNSGTTFDRSSYASAANVGSLAPGSITPTANGALIYSGLGINNTSLTATVPSGFTSVNSNDYTAGIHEGVFDAYFVQSTAAAINPSWSMSPNGAECNASVVSFLAAPSAITGTLNLNQAAQTVSAHGGPIVGSTLGLSQAAQTVSAHGGPIVGGTLSVNQAAQTVSAHGGPIVSGTLSVTQAAQTLSAFGGQINAGILNLTQAPQTVSAFGGQIVGGILGLTQASQTVSAQGGSSLSGHVIVTQASNALVASGGPVGVKHTLVTALDLVCVPYHEAQQVLSPADIAVIGRLIKRDDPLGDIIPGAFCREGLLVIPRRGVLTLQPGDVVAIDQNGWPILVSAYSIATSGWTFT